MVNMETDNDVDDHQILINKNEYEELLIKMESIAFLEDKVNKYAKQIESLLVENKELRSKAGGNVSVNECAGELPRKVPRINDNSAGRVEPLNVSNLKVKNADIIKPVSSKSASSAVAGEKRTKMFHVINDSVLKVRKKAMDAGCSNFVVRQTGIGAPVKINVEVSEAAKVRDVLIKTKASFHEYKLPEERSKCFIIKGLVGLVEDDLADVKEQLVKCGLPKDIFLSFHLTASMRERYGKAASALVKLVIPPDPNFNTEKLWQIKSLNHVGVKFETFKSKNIMQCRNCQRFGHSALGCNHKHRCVKCGEDHLKDECRRTADSNVKLVCCNCKGEHVANNLKACSFFMERFAKKTTTGTKVEGPKNTTHVHDNNKSNVRRTGVSYAAVANKGVGSKGSVRASDFNFSSMMSKIDMMFSLILKHEKFFSKFVSYE